MRSLLDEMVQLYRGMCDNDGTRPSSSIGRFTRAYYKFVPFSMSRRHAQNDTLPSLARHKQLVHRRQGFFFLFGTNSYGPAVVWS